MSVCVGKRGRLGSTKDKGRICNQGVRTFMDKRSTASVPFHKEWVLADVCLLPTYNFSLPLSTNSPDDENQC